MVISSMKYIEGIDLKKRNYKVISVSLQNYARLCESGKKNESFSDIIGNLLKKRLNGDIKEK